MSIDDLPALQLGNTRTQRDINAIITWLRRWTGASSSAHAILDEGALLPQQPNLDFVGDGVQVVDYPDTDTTRVIIGESGIGDAGADIRISGRIIQRAGNGILLFSGASGLLREYSEIGLALADATSGDIVEIPAGTIVGNITIPAGVTLRGRGWASIINGYVRGGVNAKFDNCKVYQSVNTSSDIIGVIGPDAAGTFYVRDVFVELIQAGSGKALGTLARGGAGAVLEWKGNYRIRVNGGTGSRWAAAAADDAAVILNHGSVKAWIGA